LSKSQIGEGTPYTRATGTNNYFTWKAGQSHLVRKGGNGDGGIKIMKVLPDGLLMWMLYAQIQEREGESSLRISGVPR